MLNDNQNVASVNDFLNKFDAALTEEEQHNVVREVVVNEYVPYLAKKVSLIPAISESTVQSEGTLPYFDETLFRINYFICVLILYTRLNIEEYLKENSPFDLYDECVKRGITITQIRQLIGRDMDELSLMARDLKQNWQQMNRGMDNLVYTLYQKMTNVDWGELEKMMGENINFATIIDDLERENNKRDE